MDHIENIRTPARDFTVSFRLYFLQFYAEHTGSIIKIVMDYDSVEKQKAKAQVRHL